MQYVFKRGIKLTNKYPDLLSIVVQKYVLHYVFLCFCFIIESHIHLILLNIVLLYVLE